jgi:hypothetical protein
MKASFVAAAIALAAYPLGSLAIADTQQSGDTLTVTIPAIGTSGQDGNAVLTRTDGNRTQIVITLDGQPTNTDEPVDIYNGTCDNLNGRPAYTLPPVENSSSTGLVNDPLDKFLGGGMAIIIYPAGANMGMPVACGNITIPSASPAPAASSPAKVW